jgi:hypothetical protein
MWAHNTKMAKPEYGVVFKLLKVEFEPSVSSNNMSSYEGDAFIDDEDDKEVEPTEVKEPVTVFKAKEKKQEVAEDSERRYCEEMLYLSSMANIVLIKILYFSSCCARNFEEIEPKKSKINQKMTILESINVATFDL